MRIRRWCPGCRKERPTSQPTTSGLSDLFVAGLQKFPKNIPCHHRDLPSEPASSMVRIKIDVRPPVVCARPNALLEFLLEDKSDLVLVWKSRSVRQPKTQVPAPWRYKEQMRARWTYSGSTHSPHRETTGPKMVANCVAHPFQV